jgi:hypothetical protein
MKIIFIADFFSNQISGGAELCLEEIVTFFSENNYEIQKINSHELDVTFLNNNKNSFLFISNFINLSEHIKNYIYVNKFTYVIIEHDHKYCISRNPIVYNNLIVPENALINREFYKNALCVIAQSYKHAEIMFNNLWINNITSFGCNLWSNEHLSLFKKFSNNVKNVKYAILNSNNPIKGKEQALEFCKKNNIQASLIGNKDPKQFIKELSHVETLIFLPQSFETFSRLIVEAKILNCKVITNKSSGVVYEDYIEQTGEELLNTIINKKQEILQNLKILVETKENKFQVKFKKPKISILTTIYKSGKYIESFLKQFETLEDFENNELVIVDANSPDNEEAIINQYTDKFNNIKYYKTEFCTTSEALNFAAKQANGEFLTFCFVDDKFAPNHNTVLSKFLFLYKDVDLVYGDVIVGNKENEQFNINNKYKIFEHSQNDFSTENMIKCLPGPMPMFKKQMFLNNNGFDNKMNFANDWEFWLRCVEKGSKFKKINKIVGLYYNNPFGNSTTQEKDKKNARQKEEKEVFYKYKNVFGENNFNLFKPYFDNF